MAWGGDAHGAWRPLVWGVPAALLIASTAYVGNAWADGRAGRVAVLLGDASYSIYLVHPIVIRVLKLGWDKSGASLAVHPWIFVLGSMVVIVLGCLAVHDWVEKPVTRAAQKLLLRWTSVPWFKRQVPA